MSVYKFKRTTYPLDGTANGQSSGTSRTKIPTVDGESG